MTQTVLKIKRKPFFYDAQVKRYLIQIMRMFSGYQVQFGQQRDGRTRFRDVPVVFGGTDRVVATLKMGGNMNKTVSLPIMAVDFRRLTLDKDSRRAPQHVNTAHFALYENNAIEEGNAQAEGGGVRRMAADRYMPTPYVLSLTLNLWVSNLDQGMQVVEQIGQQFNGRMDMPMSNSPYDWTGITTVNMSGEWEKETAPGIGDGTEIRNMIFTTDFDTIVWLSPPAIIRDADEVRKINVDLKSINDPIDFDTMADLDDFIIMGDDEED